MSMTVHFGSSDLDPNWLSLFEISGVTREIKQVLWQSGWGSMSQVSVDHQVLLPTKEGWPLGTSQCKQASKTEAKARRGTASWLCT